MSVWAIVFDSESFTGLRVKACSRQTVRIRFAYGLTVDRNMDLAERQARIRFDSKDDVDCRRRGGGRLTRRRHPGTDEEYPTMHQRHAPRAKLADGSQRSLTLSTATTSRSVRSSGKSSVSVSY